jgi:hypothetical protein
VESVDVDAELQKLQDELDAGPFVRPVLAHKSQSKNFRWSVSREKVLLEQYISSQPFSAPHGQSGQTWAKFRLDFEGAIRQEETDPDLSGPSLSTIKTKINLLQEGWKKKNAKALVASGVDEEQTESDDLMDSAFDLLEEAQNSKLEKTDKEKKKQASRETSGITY